MTERGTPGSAPERTLELTALGAIAHRFGDRFDQRGLPGPIVAGHQRDRCVELQSGDLSDSGHVKGKAVTPPFLDATHAQQIRTATDTTWVTPAHHPANLPRTPGRARPATGGITPMS